MGIFTWLRSWTQDSSDCEIMRLRTRNASLSERLRAMEFQFQQQQADMDEIKRLERENGILRRQLLSLPASLDEPETVDISAFARIRDRFPGIKRFMSEASSPQPPSPKPASPTVPSPPRSSHSYPSSVRRNDSDHMSSAWMAVSLSNSNAFPSATNDSCPSSSSDSTSSTSSPSCDPGGM